MIVGHQPIEGCEIPRVDRRIEREHGTPRVLTLQRLLVVHPGLRY
jgi:hypothetical protein